MAFFETRTECPPWPDLAEPVGRAHAGPDTGIDEIEQEQPDERILRLARERLHRGPADIMANDAYPPGAERIE